MKTLIISVKDGHYYGVLNGRPYDLGSYSKTLRSLNQFVEAHEVKILLVPTNAMYRRFTRAEEPDTQGFVDSLLETLVSNEAYFMITPPGSVSNGGQYLKHKELKTLSLPKVKARSTGRTLVYTDGSCFGNPGPGGWAWASKERRASGGEPHVTNNMMELQAAVEAVAAHKTPITIVSDSRYVVNNVSRLDGWRKNGYPVANADRWKALHRLLQLRDVEFQWVKGHSSSKGNIIVDKLARSAAEKQK